MSMPRPRPSWLPHRFADTWIKRVLYVPPCRLQVWGLVDEWFATDFIISQRYKCVPYACTAAAACPACCSHSSCCFASRRPSRQRSAIAGVLPAQLLQRRCAPNRTPRWAAELPCWLCFVPSAIRAAGR